MVCRSTPGNTAATTIARNQTGLHDVQVLSLFHEVRSEAPADAAAPGANEVTSLLASLEENAHRLAGRMPQRHHRTLLSNIDRARTATPPDARTYYAWRTIDTRATYARAAMETHFAAIARRHGRTPQEVEAAFNRMMARDYRVNGQAPSALAPEHVEFSTTNLPQDRGTRFALAMLYQAGTHVAENPSYAALVYPAVLRDSERIAAGEATHHSNQCPDCGRFAGDGHVCPEASTVDAATPAPADSQDAISPPEAPTVAEAPTRGTAATTDQSAPTLGTEVSEQDETSAPEPVRRRNPLRNYVTPDGGSVRLMNTSAVRAHFRANSEEPYTLDEVTVRIPGDEGTPSATVTGSMQVAVTAARRTRSRDRFTVTPDATTESERSLRCTCPDYQRDYDCIHVRQAVENVQALLNQRDPVAVAPAIAMSNVHSALREEYDASLNAAQEARAEFAAAAAAETAVSYSNDMAAFQSAWDEAKTSLAESHRLPFMTENATNGLGAREGGRSFGIEIEVDFPEDTSYTAKERVALEIYEAGLSDSPQVRGWHWRARAGNRGASHGSGYTDNPNAWSVEFDRSVDTVGGQRGCEIVSPIMYDTPETWQNIQKITEIVERNGGKVTPRTGLHVNVGAADFDHTVENHNRLIGLANAYEDVIVRAAHNPQSGASHRGRDYCRPMTMPAEGFTSIRQAQRSIDPQNYEGSSHRAMINLDHVPAEGAPIRNSTRVEVRIFDGAIDPGRIQANIKMSLGMVDAAVRGVEVPRDHERAGTHRAANVGSNGRMRRLTGEAWERDTASFRRLADTLFTRDEDKRQLTYAFAASRWQSR